MWLAILAITIAGCSTMSVGESRVKAWEDTISGDADLSDVDDAVEFRKNYTVGVLTKVGCGAVAVGIAALLFGSYINISKLTATIVIAAGIATTVSAPWLIDLTELKWVILGLVILLSLDAIAFVSIKMWRAIKPNG